MRDVPGHSGSGPYWPDAKRSVPLYMRAKTPMYFVLELPGRWEMDDSSTEYGHHHYVGEMELIVPRAALRSAAASLRAELQRFPRRKPNI